MEEQDRLSKENHPGTLERPAEGTFLYVDDNVDNRTLFRIVFEALKHNYELIVAEDAKQALELCKQRLPDLIFSDVHMPVQNGLDFLAGLKAEPDLQKIPFVLISAVEMSEDEIKRGTALGATDYIITSAHLEEFAACLQACIYKHKVTSMQQAAKRQCSDAS